MAVQGTMMNPYMNNYNSYANYATMGDIFGYDNYSFSPMSTPMTFTGCYGGFGCNGMNYQQYYDNMYQMQEFNSQYNLRNIQLQRQNEIAINSPDAGIQKALGVLQEKIASSEQEQIQGALEAYVEAVRAKYPGATDEQVRNYAAYTYSQLTGTTITADIRKYGSSSFWQGFKQSIGFGLFADNKTAAQNVAEITGQPVSRSDKMAKTAGNTLGGIAAGAAAGAAIGFFGGPIGAGAGALIGGAIGLVRGLFGF